MIVDRQEFDKFVELLPETERDEVYFVSLSARNKYLTAEERLQYSLGRTEMFSREIVRDKQELYYAMKKLRASLQYRRTSNGSEIPEKCMAVYANISPSSTIKAYHMFMNDMGHEVNEIVSCYMNGNQPNFEGIKRINNNLINCIQRSKSRKVFIDLDVDVDWNNPGTRHALTDFSLYLFDSGVWQRRIKTVSGFHFLLKRDTVPKTLYKKIDGLRIRNGIKEIQFNKNGMIPVPGTLQAGQLVTFQQQGIWS